MQRDHPLERLTRDAVPLEVAAGVPFAWVAGDEVHGRDSKLRGACEEAGKGYVLAVPSSFQARLPSARKIPVAAGPAVPRSCLGNPLVRAGLQGPP